MPFGYDGGHEPIAIQPVWPAIVPDGLCSLCRNTFVRPAKAFVCVIRRAARSNDDHRECVPCTWKARKLVAADRRYLCLSGCLRAGAVAAEKLAGGVQTQALKTLSSSLLSTKGNCTSRGSDVERIPINGRFTVCLTDAWADHTVARRSETIPSIPTMSNSTVAGSGTAAVAPDPLPAWLPKLDVQMP